MLIFHLNSAIIRDFNIVSVAGHEPEADAPWVVDSDRVLTLPGPSKFVESISRRYPKVIQMRRQVDVLELSPRPPQ
jgi:hypothetical protein